MRNPGNSSLGLDVYVYPPENLYMFIICMSSRSLRERNIASRLVVNT